MKFLLRFFWPPKNGQVSESANTSSSEAPSVLATGSRLPPSETSFAINEKQKIGTDPKSKRLFVKVRQLRPKWIEENVRFELSTYCLVGLPTDSAWKFLHACVGANAEKPLAGRADFNCTDDRKIRDVSVVVIDDNWVPERHVDVVGWPAEEFEREGICQELSKAGIVVQRIAA